MKTSWGRLRHLQGIHPETGVNQDYANEFNSRPIYIRLDPDPVVNQLSLKSRPFRKYLEVFSPEHHDLVITPQNYRAVARLDDLVDEVNSLADQSPFPLHRFREIIQECYSLVYGKKCNLQPEK